MNEPDREFANGAAKVAQRTDVIFDQIKKLSELHEEGILTDEEFTAKKQEMLSRL